MLLLSSLQQFDIEPVDFLLVLATAGLVLFFLLAALCLPFIGVVTEGIYVAKRKAFYDKCSMQISQAALAIEMFVFVILAGAVGFYFVQTVTEPATMLGPMALFIPALAALILWITYLTTWTALKRVRPVHMLFGWLGCLAFIAILFFGLLITVNIQQPMLSFFLVSNPLEVAKVLLREFVATPYLPLMFGTLLFSGLTAGAGLSQLWLIMRRLRADYGRDYYVFAMRYCARTALCSVIIATAFGGATYMLLRQSVPPELSQPQDIGIALVALGLPLSCCLLWFSIVKSESPLRHKPGAFFACLFFYIALCAQILMLFNTFPMA